MCDVSSIVCRDTWTGCKSASDKNKTTIQKEKQQDRAGSFGRVCRMGGILKSSAHLLCFFLKVLVRGQKLLVLKLFLERRESFDAVRLEERLQVGALRRLFARRLRSLFLEPVRERHLGNVIQSDGGGTSGIVKRESTHFSRVFLFCGGGKDACVCVRVALRVRVFLGGKGDEKAFTRRR
jgi:hypothetical protein